MLCFALSIVAVHAFGGIYLAASHVALTFPPARIYAFDFLDNAQTEGPCGMPRSAGHAVLDLVSGSSYNFSWLMPFAHPGGIRIELLDRDYNLVEVLAPSEQSGYFANFSDPTTLTRHVKLPHVECKNCVIRLLRTTGLWPPQTKAGYMFRSCADVNVVKKLSDDKKCSKKGAFNVTTQQCQCSKLLSGSECQYTEECVNNEDCNFPHGRCVKTNALSYPKRQCYCSRGYFVLMCDQYNANYAIGISDDLIFDSDVFNRKQVAEDFDIFWRLLADTDEIEIVARATTNSWVAIGLRSHETTTACRKFPSIPAESLSARQSLTSRGIAVAINDAEGWLSLQNEIESSPPPFKSNHLHPMGCTDIVWASAKGNFSRIRDMYSRDLSMPRDDEFYGGRQSLTAAVAFELNGTTTLIFRRPLDVAHPTDVAVEDELMHVIFAKGQPRDSSENVELNNRNVSNLNYYRTDQLGYHGADRGQRGYTRINFFGENEKLTI